MSRSATLWLVVFLTLAAFTGAMADQGSPPAQPLLSSDTCSNQLPGDATGNGVVDRDDVNFLINYICNAGPAPDPPANGDANGDCIIDFPDVDHLMAYLLYGGPAPVECTCMGPTTGACPADTCAGLHTGDVNGDGFRNIGDGVYLADFLFRGGAAPNPLANADVDGDCDVDYDDFDCMWNYSVDPCQTILCTCVFPLIDRTQPCGDNLCGDANGDGTHNVADVIYIVNFVFKGGPPPTPYAKYSGDANGDCAVNVADAMGIISYIFKGGPQPLECWYWLIQCGSPVH